MIDLSYWVKECHELAKTKGWWEPQGECKIESTSSRCCEKGTKCCVTEHVRTELELVALIHSEISEATECVRNGEEPFWVDFGKPCGEAVELVDFCIRIFDLLGKYGTELRTLNKISTPYTGLKFHGYLHSYFDWRYWNDPLSLVFNYFERMGWNFEEILKAKHEYNKTRPHRHGGKKA